ncbi:MAG: TIGR03084 family metal-binding protein [Pseudomonadota bacterium]
MQQVDDFRAEAAALANLLADVPEAQLFEPTQFKGWTIDDVLGHLHMFDFAAEQALVDPDGFQVFLTDLMAEFAKGTSIRDAQYPWLDGLKGRALFDAWQTGSGKLADAYAGADPKARVRWVGPEMSARSSITARQMETWAHGHEVFDLLGKERVEADRISNIVYLGINTFGWTFANRKLPVPDQMPEVHLTAPSGALWSFGEPQENNRVEGPAVGFAQTVTQTRNVADTGLRVTGNVAEQWMALAQCFAGSPEDPPAPGARFSTA